jgi:hypothetical protein
VNISGNSTTGAGGAVSSDAPLNITGSTLSGNQASDGGGLEVDSGSVNLVNTTLSGNGGSMSAGGIFSNGGPISLTNVTIAGNNTGGGGGGIYHTSVATSLVARNTIVAGNTAADAPTSNCNIVGPGVSSAGHNLESTNRCGFGSAGDQVNTDPKIGPLANNGGQTDTHALLAGSPAINAGDNSGCPATDQRGVARNGGCDIGAFEIPAIVVLDTVLPTFKNASVTKRWRLDSKGKAEVRATAKKRKRKPAAKGATFRYTLSENSRVVFTIERKLKGRRVKKGKRRVCAKPTRKNRKKRKCTRYTRFGSFAKQSVAGKNTKKFSGRIGKRKIKPGSYRATLVATDGAGNKSKRKRLTFKVVRR